MKSSSRRDFEEYLRHPAPGKEAKSAAWAAAIGLQRVDGLETSRYLRETARRNIDGRVTIDEAQRLIDAYYESRTERQDDGEEEADKVSARIAKILGERSFSLSPACLLAIHGELFAGIFKFAGRLRTHDISKKEWVLNGDSVMYGAAFELKRALDYDMEQERDFAYAGLEPDRVVKRLAEFVAGVWQIHPFAEGNTRATAVFAVKYMRSLGFNVDNSVFAEHSWYFRNALVRANYRNVLKGIDRAPEHLEKFFRNMLLGERNELKNRFLHVDWKSADASAVEEPEAGTPAGFDAEEVVRNSAFRSHAKRDLLAVVRGVGRGEVFGSSKVQVLTGRKAGTATAVLKRLLSLGLVEPVAGRGKGRYRLKGTSGN
ncbi:MAG: Fic family protein [Fibrobacterales bacterium]|nr:Fic family protein [Fibrobacterales bacterium]